MKKILSLVLALSLALSLCIVPAAAYSEAEKNTADALYSLDLFLGYGNDKNGNPVYGLDDNLTREQGTLLLLRMLGKINAAETAGYTHPFNDVTAYYAPYIAYAYQTGLTKGTGEKTFGFGAAMSEVMFLTFCLRSLGYSDSGANPDFQWDKSDVLATSLGLISYRASAASVHNDFDAFEAFEPTNGEAIEETTPTTAPTSANKTGFTRGDVVQIFWNALNTNLKGSSDTLADKLIREGVFTQKAFLNAAAIHDTGSALPKTLCSHKSVYSKITLSPTCEDEGERTYYCSDCGEELYTRELAALGHSWHYDSDAQQHWQVCDTCGKTKNAASHSFGTNGVCSACGYGCSHSYQESVTAPTCTAAGYTTHTCSKCGHSYTDGRTDALGHDYKSAVAKEPKCTEDGETTYTCSRCGDHYNETVGAKGHTPVTDPAVAPTCTAAGKTEGSHCSVCSAVLTAQETVSPLGHNYVNGECTRCHAKDPAYVPPKEDKGYELPIAPL